MQSNSGRLLQFLARNGIRGVFRLIMNELRFHVSALHSWNADLYKNPTDNELQEIEQSLTEAGEILYDFSCNPDEFERFKRRFPFPADYHGGENTGYWNEKIFEHFLSGTLLGIEQYLSDDVFVDVAAGGSPWALILNEKLEISAYAIDLEVGEPFRSSDCYLQEDATRTSFESSSVKGIALHCAFEMFAGDSDSRAIAEFARILKPGGKAVIVPLYMHTHDCTYSSAEFWGRGYGDPDSREYVRTDTRNIPCSRKYSFKTLLTRVLDPARRHGLTPRLYVVRNSRQLSLEIYCHFVLELKK